MESRVPTQCYKRDLIWTILMLHSGVCCEGSLPPIDCYALVDNHIIQLPSAHSVYASYNHTIQLWTLDNKMGKMCHVSISNFSQPVGSTKQLPTFSPGNRQWEPDSTSGIDLHLLVALRNDAVIKMILNVKTGVSVHVKILLVSLQMVKHTGDFGLCIQPLCCMSSQSERSEFYITVKWMKLKCECPGAREWACAPHACYRVAACPMYAVAFCFHWYQSIIPMCVKQSAPTLNRTCKTFFPFLFQRTFPCVGFIITCIKFLGCNVSAFHV